MKTADNITIALGQMKAVSEDTKTNFQTMEGMAVAAAAKGADLICFPELSYTGYFVKKEKLSELAEPVDGYFVKRLSECAKVNRICIIAGYAEREGEEIYNSCILIDGSGKTVGNVRKVHLWKSEKKRFTKGTEFPVFDTKVGKIAILNCYDLEFPEPARIVALKGAQLIFCPAAWSRPALERWKLDLRAASLYNLLFTAGANYADDLCCGSSAITSPAGNLIAQASLTEEELLIVPLNLQTIKEQRATLPYFKDLEIPLYLEELKKLLNN